MNNPQCVVSWNETDAQAAHSDTFDFGYLRERIFVENAETINGLLSKLPENIRAAVRDEAQEYYTQVVALAVGGDSRTILLRAIWDFGKQESGPLVLPLAGIIHLAHLLTPDGQLPKTLSISTTKPDQDVGQHIAAVARGIRKAVAAYGKPSDRIPDSPQELAVALAGVPSTKGSASTSGERQDNHGWRQDPNQRGFISRTPDGILASSAAAALFIANCGLDVEKFLRATNAVSDEIASEFGTPSSLSTPARGALGPQAPGNTSGRGR